MKKLILFLATSLLVGTMIACTSDTTNENEGDPVEAGQEEVQVNTNEVVYQIPNNSWELSSIFEHSIVDENGKEVPYSITGNVETLGFTGPNPIVSDENQKYFWFYFGQEDIYDKPVEVKAVKEGTEELVDLHSGSFYEGAEASADSVNMPSHLEFPSAGLWKILVYIDGEFYESIVVEVV
ncbi:hypothetical protein [Bacillus alkalicellulosilyticus]|uniref:hypothetical protein n=1 Tax=Alkalihalobacterium alkalicellulosilyticum TaxID=1912214 RepID=UPI0009981886|nr:hypothetical protein [Bacillus alkalicellulosilyticus]